MELKIHRPQAACLQTGRPFVAGEPFISALVRADGALERRDYRADAWSGPPSNTLAWWRSVYPAAAAAGATLAPADVLLDVLEDMEGNAADGPLRYLIALELLRRRAVRVVDSPPEGSGAGEDLVLACRKRDREYRVRCVSRAEAGAPGLEERLASLLWSGGAA